MFAIYYVQPLQKVMFELLSLSCKKDLLYLRAKVADFTLKDKLNLSVNKAMQIPSDHTVQFICFQFTMFNGYRMINMLGISVTDSLSDNPWALW